MDVASSPTLVDAVALASFETELGLVGALMHHQDTVLIRTAMSIIGPENFSDGVMARLFHLIHEAVAEGLSGFPMIARVLANMRGDVESLAADGWTPSRLVAHCISSSIPAIGVEGAARQVKHDFLARRLKDAVAHGDTATAETSAAEMERLSKAHLSKADGQETLGASAQRVINAMNAAHMDGVPPRDFAHCGLRDLARAIGGWRSNKLYIIAGRPGMGKSTLTWSTMMRTALKGHPVMFFSLEMGRDELTEMALTDLAWRRNNRIEYRDINVSQCDQTGFAQKLQDVIDVAPMFNSLPLMIHDRGGVTVAEIRSQAMQYDQRLRGEGRRLEVLVVDHLGLIKASSTYAGNKVAETEEVSGQLKQLAKELQCAVVALAQLSRQVEQRDDKRPTLSDLRWSGGIEQDADVVMFVYREEYYLKKTETDSDKEFKRTVRLDACRNKLEVLIEKQRGGPTYGVELFCDMGCSVVRDLEQHQP